MRFSVSNTNNLWQKTLRVLVKDLIYQFQSTNWIFHCQFMWSHEAFGTIRFYRRNISNCVTVTYVVKKRISGFFHRPLAVEHIFVNLNVLPYLTAHEMCSLLEWRRKVNAVREGLCNHGLAKWLLKWLHFYKMLPGCKNWVFNEISVFPRTVHLFILT